MQCFSKCVSLSLVCFSLMACGGGGAATANPDLSQIASDNASLSGDAVVDSNHISVDSAPVDVLGDCELSVLDEQMIGKINEVRAQARYCGDEFYPAVGSLDWHCDLEGATERHSRDMGDNNFFSHTGSDGSRVGQRADDAGYPWVMVGENIAVGFSSVDGVMQGWLNSPSHCRTIMKASYTEMAHSLYLPQDADYGSYWTLVLGKRASY